MEKAQLPVMLVLTITVIAMVSAMQGVYAEETEPDAIVVEDTGAGESGFAVSTRPVHPEEQTESYEGIEEPIEGTPLIIPAPDTQAIEEPFPVPAEELMYQKGSQTEPELVIQILETGDASQEMRDSYITASPSSFKAMLQEIAKMIADILQKKA